MVPGTILVAVDGSPASCNAEIFAAELANAGGKWEIEVATVIRPRSIPYRRMWPFVRISSEEDVNRARALLSAASRRVQALLTNPESVVVEQVVENESPAQGIIEESLEKGDCKLIIIGNRGKGGLESLALGSVSSQVVHESTCPVIVVKT